MHEEEIAIVRGGNSKVCKNMQSSQLKWTPRTHTLVHRIEISFLVVYPSFDHSFAAQEQIRRIH